jgi:hypothetical protein
MHGGRRQRAGRANRDSSPRFGVELGAELLEADRLSARRLVTCPLDGGLLFGRDRLVVERRVIERGEHRILDALIE